MKTGTHVPEREIMIKIITDSTSDYTMEEAEKKGLVILPLRVLFGEEEYLDRVNLSVDDFYNKLIETDVFPKTSQIPPFTYEEAMEKEVEAGNEVLVFTVSSKLSGCYQSAVNAASSFGDKVRVIDTLSVSMGIQILIERALAMIAEGKGLDEIVERLEEEKQKIRVVALLDTLEYLKKGGRISSTKAMAGKILGIKPVISFDGGEVNLLGTARGSKSGSNLLMKYTEENAIDLSRPFGMVYSGFSDVLLKKYINDSARLYEGRNPSDFVISRLGACVGTYAGPGTIGVAYFTK